MAERIYPVGIQTFSDIINRGCVYVDKTDLIYKLTKKYKYVFLSRPRRFGKSLLSTTLHSYFAGEKDLFKGLAIEGLEKDWTEYPVLHFDMSTFKNCNLKDLQSKFNYKLSEYESIWGKNPESETPGDRFKNLIISAKEQTGKPVIIIIDEYDAPLLDVLHNEDRLAEIRTVIQEFYAPIKANDEYIRFTFITGITKFSQLSIFSAINNLSNISMDPEFAAICGITKEELTTTLSQDIELMAEHNGVSKEEMARMLQENYDGYHFSHDNMVDVFNPFSLINALADSKLRNYWASSGATSMLPKFVDDMEIRLKDFDHCALISTTIETSDVTGGGPELFLYQSGYLTIKGYVNGTYLLGIPNFEVRQALNEIVLPTLAMRKNNDIQSTQAFLNLYLSVGNLPEAMKCLKALVADVPYSNKKLASMDMEERYRLILSTIFNAIGCRVEVEKMIATGRIDIVVETTNFIYVLELKLSNNGGIDSATEQIRAKQYTEPFKADKRKVVAIAIELDEKGKGLVDWKEVPNIAASSI